MSDQRWIEFEEMGESIVRQKLANGFGDNKAKSAREWLAWKEAQRLLASEAAKEAYSEVSIRMLRRQDIKQTIMLIAAIPAAMVAVISIYLYYSSK
jgi:hypothetical protein